MGTVFEAEHLLLGRSVAVKVLHPNLAPSKDSVRRFHREARAAGCIGHPNVCEVHDLDVMEDGTPYMVMEKLVGHTLSRRMAVEGRLPLFELVEVLLQVLSALAAAHERGIVHRDIKPDNVFLAKRTGCSALAKLLDFGVSKIVLPAAPGAEREVDLTRRGMVMGTPHYMSPEQARGDRDLDPRVDLYACGVILYEGLTGQRPFAAARQADLLRDILHAQPRPVRELRRALPSGFEIILARSMARDRDDRYRSAIEFQGDLRGLRERLRQEPAPINPFRSTYPPIGRPSDVADAPTRVWMAPMPGLDDDQKTLVRPPRSRDLLRTMGDLPSPIAEPERVSRRTSRGSLRS
jgi:serine/threonine protein kinase